MLNLTKNIYSLVHKTVLVSIADFPVPDNCTKADFFFFLLNSPVLIKSGLKVMHNNSVATLTDRWVPLQVACLNNHSISQPASATLTSLPIFRLEG